MTTQEKIIALREAFWDKAGASYGKLLNPLRNSFAYTVDDLISYLEFAAVLCKDLDQKFNELLSRKSIYHARYGEKSRKTQELISKTAKKISFLQLKLKRLEKTWEEENLDEIFDEIVDEMDEDSDDRIMEFEEDLVLERKHSSSYNKLRESIKSEPIKKFDSPKENRLTKTWSRSTTMSTSDWVIKQDLLDDMNFESVIEKIATVGVNPTALCTETLIIVLLKMEKAIDNLLIYQNNHDYSELFYRADFMKTYECTIHEIIKMPDDDVFYLQ